MSNVLALDYQNKSVGQFDALAPSLSWSLNGNPNVSGGGSTSITAPNSVAENKWLGLGRMVVIEPEDLPAYMGMIDTPWTATEPVGLSIYDPEYLFNLRTAEASPIKFTGTVDKILRQVIDITNAGDDLFLRLGVVGDIDRTQREETIDGRPLWEQVKALLLRSGTEMQLRAGKGDDLRWYVYVDIAKTMGTNTEFLLRDGEGGNMKIRSATVRGEIINRVVGINSASTPASRLQTRAFEDAASRALYKMRNRLVQSRDVTDLKTLETNTQYALASSSVPQLEMTVDVVNVEHAFRYLRLGNRLMTHASRIRLPWGVQGWRGMMRITRMSFLEATKTVNMTLTGDL